MPFCEYCGKEIPADPNKKFCGRCGAPIEQPEIPVPGTEIRPEPGPATEVPPPVPSPPPASSPDAAQPVPYGKTPPAKPVGSPAQKYFLPAVLIVIVILAAAAWFIGMPVLGGLQGAGSEDTAASTGTPLPTIALPDPTVPPATAVPESPAPTPIQTVEERYGETYTVIYFLNRTFDFGEKIPYPCTLTQPPLYIKFVVDPVMKNDTKIADIGLSSEHVVYVSYADPAAWFEVKVLDANGDSVDSQGFGVAKGYSNQNRQEFMVRKSGDYIIEMSGNMVDTVIEIRTGTS